MSGLIHQAYRYVLCGTLLWLVGTAQAQENTTSQGNFARAYTNIIPPAPEAANLGKYVETPVDLSSGQPSIGIPIYTLKGKEISVPVSLSYRSGGIKVEEMASWVGLGWTLNAGGVITRTVYGHPDGHVAIRCHLDAGEVEKMQKFLRGKPDGCDPLKFQDLSNEYVRYQQDILKNSSLDTEPDLYFFNFNGYSGKIFIDENYQPHIMSHQPLKIQVTPVNPVAGGYLVNREPASWTVTTPDGAQYFFDVKGNTHQTPGDQGNFNTGSYGDRELNYTSSWYLSRIVSPNYKDTMSFAYTKVRAEVDRQGYHMEHYKIEIGSITNGNTDPTGASGSTVSYGPTGVTTNDEFYLWQIKSNHGEVLTLVHNKDRKDRKNKDIPLLEKVVVYNYRQEGLKQVNFYHDYFVSAGVEGSTAPHRYHRLKLDSVTIGVPEVQVIGGTSSLNLVNDPNQKMTYKFGYDATLLPHRFSKSQDYWGYYNGVSNNTLIPKMTFNNIFYPGADRSPNPTYGKACLLNKIVYPTKGYKVFEFEGHSVNDHSVSGGYFTSTTQTRIVSGGVDSLPDSRIKSFVAPIDPLNPNVDNSKTYWTYMTIEYREGDEPPLLTIEASGDNGVDAPNEQLYSAFGAFLIKVSDNFVKCNKNPFLGSKDKIVFEKQGPGGGFKVTSKSAFLNHGYGTYQVLLTNAYPHFSLKAHYEVRRPKPLTDTYTQKPIGGVRLKAVKSYNYDHKLIQEKTYGYLSPVKMEVRNHAYRRQCIKMNEDGTIDISNLLDSTALDQRKTIEVETMMSNGVEVLKYGLEDHYQISRYIQKPCIIGTIDLASVKTKETSEIINASVSGGSISVTMSHFKPLDVSNGGMSSYVLPEQEKIYLERFAGGRSQLGALGGNPVVYRHVEEKVVDFSDTTGTANNGRVSYSFSTQVGKSSVYPYTAPDHSNFLGNGLLLAKRVFDNQDRVLVEELNEYKDDNQVYKSVVGLKLGMPLVTYNDDYVWGYRTEAADGCTRMVYTQDCQFTLLNVYEGFQIVHDSKELPIQAYKERATAQYILSSKRPQYLSRSISRQYDYRLPNEQNYVENIKTYEYVSDPQYSSLVRSVTSTTSKNNEWLKEVSYYPFDHANALLSGGSVASYQTMRNRHWVGKVVGKETFRLQGADLSTAIATPVHQLREHYVLNANNQQLQLESVAVALNGQNLQTRLKSFEYDAMGNLLGYEKDGFYQAMIWGYNGLYPVAQVAGARAKDVWYTSFEQNGNHATAKTGQRSSTVACPIHLTNLSNGQYVLSFWQLNAQGKWEQHQSLHTVSNGSFDYSIAASASQAIDEVRFYPVGTQMSSYTYLPGIGQSSITAPSGQTVYYVYDKMGRLSYTRDFENNVLQTYEYHFRND